MRIPRPFIPIICLVFAGLGGRPAYAQTSDTLSDRMLIRLGAAVSGYPSGLPVWVVTCVPDNQVVLSVVMAQRDAMTMARDSSTAGRRCAPHGPFLGSPDSLPPQLLAYGAVHQPDSKYDSTHAGSSPVLMMGDVQDITIIVRRRIGPAITRVYLPDQIDAVFFTLPAMDKFLFPYYQWVYGVDYAARMRAAIRAHLLAGPAR
jgi:hypothetical protein